MKNWLNLVIFTSLSIVPPIHAMDRLNRILGHLMPQSAQKPISTPAVSEKGDENALASSETYHLHTIFSSPALRQQFSGFIDNVLRQVPSDKFYAYIDTIQSSDNPYNDAEFYAKIMQNISNVKPRFSLYCQLQSLKHQKKVLTAQAQQLIGNNTQIQGSLEIGQPATYINSMKSFLSINGPVYVLNETSGMTDYIQAGSIRPYTNFIPMNNYEPISEKAIPSNSIDLIVCFIGLHHIPQEKIAGFVASLHRILRPGGMFILRDHDAHNPQIMSMAYAAHSIFNTLIPSLPLQEELNEYRNFQPLQYWIDLLESNGFKIDTMRLQQNGDPSLNTMLKFTKVAQTPEEQQLQVSHELKRHPNYQEDIIRTYLKTTEWLSVDLSHEYANFVNHTPFYEFPWFKSIALYWTLFAKSWRVAAQRRGHWATLASSETLMNAFIGVTMTVEHIAKGLISAPIRLTIAGEAPTTMKMLISDPQHEIEQIDNRIKVLNQYPNSTLKLIEIPRYKEFLKIMLQMAHTNIGVCEVAGQKEIQFKVRHQHNQIQHPFKAMTGCKKEYSWQLPTQPQYIYTALNVQINEMLGVIKQVQSLGIEILYIHDF